LVITGQPNGKDIKHGYTVSAVEEKDGETIVTIKRHVDGVTYIDDKITLSKEGMFYSGGKSHAYDPSLPALKYPIEKDATWKWKGKYGKEERSQTRTILGTEEVQVTAGKFTAVKVEVEEMREKSGDKFKSKEWYVAGVGRVKWTSGNLTEEMTSFTAAKK
jgi:hypothetical protein